MTATSDPFAVPAGGAPSDSGQQQGKTAQVAQSAKESGAEVAQSAAEQAKSVTADAGNELRDLVHQARHQLREQAGGQQQKVVEGLRSLVGELRGMADNSEQSGPATQMVRQASQVVGQTADWLEQREPGDLIDEVRRLGRRKPGAFLAGAALAGVLAGRMTRGIKDATSDGGSGSTGRGTTGIDGASGTAAIGGSGGTGGFDGTGGFAERRMSADPTAPIPAVQPGAPAYPAGTPTPYPAGTSAPATAYPPEPVLDQGYPPEPYADPVYGSPVDDLRGRRAGDPGVAP